MNARRYKEWWKSVAPLLAPARARLKHIANNVTLSKMVERFLTHARERLHHIANNVTLSNVTLRNVNLNNRVLNDFLARQDKNTFKRAASIGGLAVLITVALFLTMKVLITGQEFELEAEAASIGIDFIRVERDEDVNAKDRSLKRPSKQTPEEPPPPPKLEQVQRPNIEKASLSTDLSGLGFGMNLNAPVDGDVLAILRVLPRYPSRALTRGIEGWVLLEFTISKLGLAIEPIVIDAEPQGIFNNSAINAVKKWKYRPQIIDGRPAPRSGVRQLISYEISE